MFIWLQIDDQRQRSLVTAGAQTANTSEAVYVLTAVSACRGGHSPFPSCGAAQIVQLLGHFRHWVIRNESRKPGFDSVNGCNWEMA